MKQVHQASFSVHRRTRHLGTSTQHPSIRSPAFLVCLKLPTSALHVTLKISKHDVVTASTLPISNRGTTRHLYVTLQSFELCACADPDLRVESSTMSGTGEIERCSALSFFTLLISIECRSKYLPDGSSALQSRHRHKTSP